MTNSLFGDGLARGERRDAAMVVGEGEMVLAMGERRGMSVWRWTSHCRQKNNLLLEAASEYVLNPAHLQWALARQLSHWTESG